MPVYLAEGCGYPNHIPVRITRTCVLMSPPTSDAEASSNEKLIRSYISVLYMSGSHEDLEKFLGFPTLVLNLVTWCKTVRHRVN